MRGLVHEAGKWNIFSLPWYDVNIIYLFFIFLHITWIQVETQIDTLTCTCGIVNKLLACTSGVVNKLFVKNFVIQLVLLSISNRRCLGLKPPSPTYRININNNNNNNNNFFSFSEISTV